MTFVALAALGLSLLAIGALLAVRLWNRSRLPPSLAELSISSPEPGCTLRFVVVGGQDSGRTYEAPLRERVLLGLAHDCDVQVADDVDVTNTHCVFTRREDRVYLHPLGSDRSTLLNGAPLEVPRPVESNDTIRVGRTELRIFILGHP